MRRVMFDIDGTLVDSDAFDGECFCAAVREVTGGDPDPDWTRYRHVTDAGILAQHLRERGLQADAAAIGAEVRRSFTRRIAARSAGGGAGRWTYFGDGEWDRLACARLGFDFVLVGNRTRHPRVIEDFSDPTPALAYLGFSPAPAR